MCVYFGGGGGEVTVTGDRLLCSHYPDKVESIMPIFVTWVFVNSYQL